MQSLDRIVEDRIIGMVTGRPGVGKTETIGVWRRKHPAVRHVAIVVDVLTSPRPVLTALVRALGLGATAGHAEDLYLVKCRVAERLAADPILVIFDEADLLTVRAFELLRSIWDCASEIIGENGERAFPLALFGAPKLRQMLERDDLERLHRRIFHATELPPLARKELEVILATNWKQSVFDAAAIDQLLALARGSFGWVNNIMRTAARLAAKDGQRVTPEIIRAVRQHTVGLPI
jgi:type II secretory pathway predicted ATPase ExeA